VLVIEVLDEPPAPRRRLRRARPKDSDPDAVSERPPLTRLTVIRPQALGERDAARAWLAEIRDDDDAIRAELGEALEFVNLAISAQRVSSLDPHLPDVSAERALVVRIGFGTGDEVADGLFTEAIDVPRATRRRRLETLRPQERIAAVLGGRELLRPAAELLLRARADLDAGRVREAALQLRVGLEALLAEPRDAAPAAEAQDLGVLDERRAITGEAAGDALAGDLSEARAGEVAETLRLCERVLRRRALS
jgi:hypothetical protein